MCTTDIQLVEAYEKGNPHERFTLIYKNYDVFLRLVESYETGLFNRILYEREYNIRAKLRDDDLGVRINTNRISDTTAKKAIERIMIRDAIEKADFSGDILDDTDNPEKHRQDILTIRMMRREYEVFDSCLKALPEKEYSITYRYIHGDKKITEIAEEEDRAYQTIKNLVNVTKKALEKQTIPNFREVI